MSIMKRALMPMAGAGLAVVGALMTATPASAGVDQSIVTARGSVAWYHDGDIVQVCDAKKDGYSIEANYRLSWQMGPGRVVHVAGAGKCDQVTDDKNEGHTIEIRMCYRDDFIITKCSDWQRGKA
jgi:hypothetical protein